jgi:hypothetical protein
MSGFHACWSIGTFAGAAAGVAGVAIGMSLSVQLLLLGVPALVIGEALITRMLPDPGAPAEATIDNARPARRFSRAVLILGAIAFASMLCEGASADWGSVYLRGPVHAGAAVAGLGYTAYSLTMVIVRLSGNPLLARFRAQTVLPILAAVAGAGFTAGLAVGTRALAITGFACLGIGLALVVPTVNSAAGRLPGLTPGAAIVAVSTCGWLGFVCGPPLIGALASATSLPAALGVVPVLVAFIAVATALTPYVRTGSYNAPARSRAAR